MRWYNILHWKKPRSQGKRSFLLQACVNDQLPFCCAFDPGQHPINYARLTIAHAASGVAVTADTHGCGIDAQPWRRDPPIESVAKKTNNDWAQDEVARLPPTTNSQTSETVDADTSSALSPAHAVHLKRSCARCSAPQRHGFPIRTLNATIEQKHLQYPSTHLEADRLVLRLGSSLLFLSHSGVNIVSSCRFHHHRSAIGNSC